MVVILLWLWLWFDENPNKYPTFSQGYWRSYVDHTISSVWISHLSYFCVNIIMYCTYLMISTFYKSFNRLTTHWLPTFRSRCIETVFEFFKHASPNWILTVFEFVQHNFWQVRKNHQALGAVILVILAITRTTPHTIIFSSRWKRIHLLRYFFSISI